MHGNKKELFVSIMAGLILSLTIIRLELGVAFAPQFILLIPISLLAGMLEQKWTCLSYSIGIIYILDCVFQYCGIIKGPILPYSNFAILVGILHVLEGLFTIVYGWNDTTAISDYRGNERAGGYQMYRRWFVPLLFFMLQGIYIPILVIVIYADESCTMKARKKASIMGSAIGMYGLIIIGVGFLSRRGVLPISLMVACMVIFHELLFSFNEWIEKRGGIHLIKPKGIKILEVCESDTFHHPFLKGDIIEEINGERVTDLQHYEELIYLHTSSLELRIYSKGHIKHIACEKKLLDKSELKLEPTNPIKKSSNH